MTTDAAAAQTPALQFELTAIFQELLKNAGAGASTAYAVSIGNWFDHLLVEEQLILASARDKRRNEFSTGRMLARRCLAELGVVDGPLLRNDNRSPRWPANIVGSISHTNEVCGVAVAHSRDITALGIDFESAVALKPNLWRHILTPDEQTKLAVWPEIERGRMAKIAFSAKEAIYKMQYPLTQTFLGFQEAEIDIGSDNGTNAGECRAHIRHDCARRFATPIKGRYCIAHDLVMTAFAVSPAM